MKLSKYMAAFAIAILASVATTASGKGVMTPRIYMFGFAASFTDSTVYFTPVQAVDSVWIDSKTGFLMGRDNYSLQLKNMLANKMQRPNRTCIVMFGKKRKDLENKFLKMQKLYTDKKGKGKYDVRYIMENDFHFQAVNMNYEEGPVATEPQQATPSSRPTKKTKK